MSSVQGRAVAFSAASRKHVAANETVKRLRAELVIAEEALKKADMDLNRTKRELLEEAKLT